MKAVQLRKVATLMCYTLLFWCPLPITFVSINALACTIETPYINVYRFPRFPINRCQLLTSPDNSQQPRNISHKRFQINISKHVHLGAKIAVNPSIS